MSHKTYSGSCHCGAVRFETDLDLTAGSNRCNCSLCFKARAWFAFAKGAASFRLLAGSEALREYRWTPAGMAGPFLTYAFCGHCGIRVFGRGELPALGGTFHAVPVTTLDAPAEELAASPVNYVDGRNGRFDRAPEDLRLL
jgi:hypothetical protein